MHDLDKERFEKIEAYLMGSLPPGDMERFEAAMAGDPALRQDVDVQRQHMLAVELGGFERMLRKIGNDRSSSLREQAIGPWSYRWGRLLAVAASVAALVAVAVWWAARPPLNERLFSENFTPDPGLPVPMSATDDRGFQDAMVAYKLGDYQEAREKWTTQLQSKASNDTLRYYIAQAMLAMNDPGPAVPLLESVMNDSTSSFSDLARWPLFLAWIARGDIDRATKVHFPDDDPHLLTARSIQARLGK